MSTPEEPTHKRPHPPTRAELEERHQILGVTFRGFDA